MGVSGADGVDGSAGTLKLKNMLIRELKNDQDLERKYLLIKTIVSACEELILLDSDFLQEWTEFIYALKVMTELLDELFIKDE